MPVGEYGDFNATATRLVWADGDPPDYRPEAPPVSFPVLVLQMDAEETLRVGKDTSKEVVKMFCNLNADLSSPASEEHRVEVSGWGRYDVFSKRRITAEGESIAILLGERFG